MAEKEKLEVQVTTQGADRAARELDQVAKKADEVDGKKIDLDVGGLDKFAAMAGPAGAIAAIGAGFAFAVDQASDLAIEADNLAALTGDSVEQASRLNAVWKQTGADTKDLQDVLLQMNGVLSTNADIAKQLGVNLEDGATVGERFEQVAEALDKIPDAAKRSQIASQVFGEEGVRQYNALRNSVDDLSGALENVPAGLVFDEEDAERARELKRQINELKAELASLAAEVGGRTIPVVNDVIDGFKGWFSAASDAGQMTRNFLRGDFSLDQFDAVEALEAGERAAADFDRQLLDGLSTFADVRQKVLDLTGSQLAANLVALEWAQSQGEVDDALESTSQAAGIADKAWQSYIDTLSGTNAAAQGASGSFSEMNAAVDAALQPVEELTTATRTMSDVFGELREKVDFVGEAFDEFDKQLDLQDRLDDITDQFAEIAEAQKKVGEDGEEGVRRYDRAVRDLQRMLRGLVAEIDSIPPAKKVEFLAEIQRGGIDELYSILGQLTKGVTVPVSFSAPKTDAFSGANFSFDPNAGKIATNFLNPNPAPAGSVSNSTTNNYFPVGTSPTSVTVDGRIYDSRNQFGRTGIR